MNRVLRRYEIPFANNYDISLPKGSDIIAVVNGHDNNSFGIMTLEPRTASLSMEFAIKRLQVCREGALIPDHPPSSGPIHKYIGSVNVLVEVSQSRPRAPMRTYSMETRTAQDAYMYGFEPSHQYIETNYNSYHIFEIETYR